MSGASNDRVLAVQKCVNPIDMVTRALALPVEAQADEASEIFNIFFSLARQPKSASGNACAKLCGFVEQCSKCPSDQVRSWAFSEDVLQRLFTFYLEWNETEQHRSMKSVLDLIIHLQRRNPDREASESLQKSILDTLISVTTGLSAKPVAKSVIKALDYFFVKAVFNLDDIQRTHSRLHQEGHPSDELKTWRRLFQELLHWMRFHFASMAAGKLMVSLYRSLRKRDSKDQFAISIELWHSWLLEALIDEPTLLESIKHYIFLPLFKDDRSEALHILRRMTNGEATAGMKGQDIDTPALIQLAALETGKRVGLVEEPALSLDVEADGKTSTLVLQESTMINFLAHPNHEVRTLALSLLVTSPSMTRPYSASTLELLRSHLGPFFADPDAKFRMDVMTKTRDMFKRVRGSICTLKRSLQRAQAKSRHNQLPPNPRREHQVLSHHTNLIYLPEHQLADVLQYHEQFLRWYIRFLCMELTPTASYQRHIASLKALRYILRLESDENKKWATFDDQVIFFDLFDGTWARALFDLVMDPFEDVRDFTAEVLKALLSDSRYRKFSIKGSQDPIHELSDLCSRAEEVARRTSRADHADGTARAFQLLYDISGNGAKRLDLLGKISQDLERKIILAETDLGQAVLEAPVHSDFAALSYLWQVVLDLKFDDAEHEAMTALQAKFVSCCEKVWQAVERVLCDDSPEGHIPQDLEETDGLDTKDVLSYSFRAVHESNNFMRVVVLSIKNNFKEGYLAPPSALFERIGNLTFLQLSTLRHRGAFSTVSQTFATCCQHVKYLKDSDLGSGASLLDIWYQGAMDTIFVQASTTRRSAGIPSLITGILSSNAANPSFDEVLEKLVEIASVEALVRDTDGSNLPQVHAHNCLKDIFKSSLLTSTGNKAEKYIPTCLELAANSLKSEVWAIRNCGLILLRSLIDSLLGTQESKSMIEAGWDGKASRIPYHKYPTLPSVLLNLVKAGSQMMTPTATTTVGAESVFPALDIVRRGGPPELLRDELEVHISTYLSSPVWHVRDIAARTLCSCLLHDRWLSSINRLVQACAQDQTSNARNHAHGLLLTLRSVFERQSEVAPARVRSDLPEFISIVRRASVVERHACCLDVIATFLEIVNLIWAFQSLESQELTRFDLPAASSCDGALLKIQWLKNEVIAASQLQTPALHLNNILIKNKSGQDTLSAVLEIIPTVWNVANTPESVLAELSTFYMDVCLETEPQPVALNNLAGIIDRLLESMKYHLIDFTRLQRLWGSIIGRSLGPSLSNAIIRCSGCIAALSRLSNKISESGLRNWGLTMADAGLDANDFDTRFAAAESLQSFFSVIKDTCVTEDCLTALFALYDTLNDDDDEVRDIGSAAASSILGDFLVPLEASSRLLQWLCRTFGDTASFRAAVASRMTGASNVLSSHQDWVPAETQLNEAVQFDDSLFVVEEKNLYIDEIRESRRWARAFASVEWSSDADTITRLEDWLWRQGGTARLLQLLDQDDGPLGWASDPEVFAVCSRIILSSVAVESKGCASPGLCDALSSIRSKLGSVGGRHTSGLLKELLTLS